MRLRIEALVDGFLTLYLAIMLNISMHNEVMVHMSLVHDLFYALMSRVSIVCIVIVDKSRLLDVKGRNYPSSRSYILIGTRSLLKDATSSAATCLLAHEFILQVINPYPRCEFYDFGTEGKAHNLCPLISIQLYH